MDVEGGTEGSDAIEASGLRLHNTTATKQSQRSGCAEVSVPRASGTPIRG